VSGGLAGSLAFAVGAGVATLLSPCALPLVPGYVGYYVSVTDTDHQRTGLLVRGVGVAVGIMATLVALAGGAILVGRPIVQSLSVVEPLVGVALVALGAVVLTGRGPDWTLPLPERRADVGGFALFGIGYAGAAASCTLPVFLGVVVQALTLSASAAALVVAAYAGSVAVGMLGLTLGIGLGVDATLGRLTAYGSHLKRAAGVVLIGAGVGQVVVAVAPEMVPTVP